MRLADLRYCRVAVAAAVLDTAAIAHGLGIPYVRVIRRANVGKPGALSRGIAEARGEILVLVDGDTIFEPATIELLIRPMRAPDVGAVSGNTVCGDGRCLAT